MPHRRPHAARIRYAMIQLLSGHEKDLGGGFRVARLLPNIERRTIGPWVFLDHFGPIAIAPGMNTDVRPHPHIGLATVSYLLEGAMMHRDSLGSVQRIEPGAINLMKSGRGIVHSERSPGDLRGVTHHMHGLQMWLGLPTVLEESEPSFAHTPASALPGFIEQQAEVRVLMGHAFGRQSPVQQFSPTLFLMLKLQSGGALTLPALAPEIGVYAVTGDLRVDDTAVGQRQLAAFDGSAAHVLTSPGGGHIAVIGGAPLDGPRYLSWNFVSSRRSRLEQAAADWKAQRFAPVAGETEFIPLPEPLP
jgi:redox-sensitive bicupin YhaK (pirin superfamily)